MLFSPDLALLDITLGDWQLAGPGFKGGAGVVRFGFLLQTYSNRAHRKCVAATDGRCFKPCFFVFHIHRFSKTTGELFCKSIRGGGGPGSGWPRL